MAKRKQVKQSVRQAQERNRQQRELREQEARRKAWWNQHGKTTITIAVIAVVAILVLWLGLKWFWGPGGSIPNFFGYLRGVEDTWVVTDLNPNTNANAGSSNVDSTPYGNSPRYFHLATFEPLEGYTQDPGFTDKKDKANQDQHYIPDSEDGILSSVYVFGIPNKNALKHVGDMQYTMGLSNITAESVVTTLAGFEVNYVYFVYNLPVEEGSDVPQAYGTLCLCIDTPHDACVMVLMNTRIQAAELLPPVEDVLAEAEKILPNLTICE